jgi:hypothetical protein
MTALRGSRNASIAIAIAGAGRRRRFLTSRQRGACLFAFPAWGQRLCRFFCPIPGLTFPQKSGHRVMRLLPLPAVG